jgi:chemotaxis signal transduction protein
MARPTSGLVFLCIVSDLDPPSEQRGVFLVAKSAGETFGIPATPIIRVLRNLTIHGVPGASPPLIGLTQYAGEPVPVIDLVELGGGQAAAGSHAVVVLLRCGADPATDVVGVAVDEAVRLVTPDSHIEMPDTGQAVSDPMRVEGIPIRLVDPARIGNPGVGAN